jgi:hypothetical protein
MQNSLGYKEKYLNQTSNRKRHLVRPRHGEKDGRDTKNLKVTGVCVCVCGGGGDVGCEGGVFVVYNGV